MFVKDTNISDESNSTVDLPICVDLDGTLINTDLLLESVVLLLRQCWRKLVYIPWWLWRGKAYLKSRLAENVNFDPTELPYNIDLIEYLRQQNEKGRAIVLVTASDHKLANKVSDHLSLFSKVLASDGKLNLKGKKKALALVENFGEKGFIYAGNDNCDLAVWKHAHSAIVVNGTRTLTEKASEVTTVEEQFPPPGNRILGLLKAIRYYQWVKNILVFIPAITGLKLLDVNVIMPTFTIFCAFSVAASGTYLLNDLMDLEADRRHPRKRNRPFASGTLPLHYAWLSPLLLLSGIALGFVVSMWCGLLIALYATISTTYSIFLKSRPLVDVFTLAVLYTTRVLAGGLAAQLDVSIWILSFAGFLFLALAFLKRTAEFIQSADQSQPNVSRRGYTSADVLPLQIMGLASSFVSCLVLSLYMDSSIVMSNYQNPIVLWGLVPLFLFWQCRLWLSTFRGHMDDDPIVYAAKDHVSWGIFSLAFVIYISAIIRL